MQPFVRKVVNELISLSNDVTSRDKRTNDSKDSIDELINSLSGSNCIGLAYEAVTWWTNDSNPKTRKVN